jgi:hypothetical protein
LVGLTEVGGVGYADVIGVFAVLEVAGPMEADGARVKWLPGPVSSLGPGAVKGSRRYLEACSTSVRNGSNDVDHHAIKLESMRHLPVLACREAHPLLVF